MHFLHLKAGVSFFPRQIGLHLPRTCIKTHYSHTVSYKMSITLGLHQLTQQIVSNAGEHQYTVTERTFSRS